MDGVFLKQLCPTLFFNIRKTDMKLYKCICRGDTWNLGTGSYYVAKADAVQESSCLNEKLHK